MILERARKRRGRLANTPCLFTSRHQDLDDFDIAPDGEEPEEYFAPTTAGECIQFWPWVNKVKSCSRDIIIVICALILMTDTHDGVAGTTTGNRDADF